VTGPVRIKPSQRYVKSLQKIGKPLSTRAERAVEKFRSNPDLPGLNFEPYKGKPGYFTIRVERNYRILLKEEQDKEGPYYLLVDIAEHDNTY
jgi:hypothetical protein